MNYLIRSFEHEFTRVCWWGPNRCGYTEKLEEAGRYSGEEAAEIVTAANIVSENEKIVREAWAHLEKPMKGTVDDE